MADVVYAEVDDGVGLVTLNRPAQRNAFNAEMGRLLGECLRAFDEDDRVRVIVLTGAPPAFCAGADITAGAEVFAAPTDDRFSASPVDPAAFELRKPVIAAVNGHAIGIGLTLALQADMRFMADDARYAIPQVRLGVLPDAMSHWTLPRIVGMANAAELLMTGGTFDGATALRIGLANRVLPAPDVLPAALELARDIAVNVAPLSAALSKRLLWDTAQHGYGPRQVADLETALHRRVMGGADAAEGVRALAQRRPPRWSARLSSDWQDLP